MKNGEYLYNLTCVVAQWVWIGGTRDRYDTSWNKLLLLNYCYCCYRKWTEGIGKGSGGGLIPFWSLVPLIRSLWAATQANIILCWSFSLLLCFYRFDWCESVISEQNTRLNKCLHFIWHGGLHWWYKCTKQQRWLALAMTIIINVICACVFWMTFLVSYFGWKKNSDNQCHFWE